jgi:hypothetical protein
VFSDMPCSFVLKYNKKQKCILMSC